MIQDLKSSGPLCHVIFQDEIRNILTILPLSDERMGGDVSWSSQGTFEEWVLEEVSAGVAMNHPASVESVRKENVGLVMYDLLQELFPICRSITGDGVRTTLGLLQRSIPLEIREVPSGTQAFDWVVPREWNIADAYIKNSKGERVVDFQKSNLHVMGYSMPVCRKMSLEELRPHLFSLPEHPYWIPYRTSYYKDNWGFCLSHATLQQMQDDDYEVCIDSRLAPGSLTYGECFLPGETDEEILISTHVCHPSLCNDNLSGVVVATKLAETLALEPKRYSYRFLFIPGTIGSITWLALNESRVSAIKHGLVLTGIGDSGGFTYKKSRRGDTEIDRVVEHLLSHLGTGHQVREFSPYGYDERQYCSPGFNLPIGCLMRTPHGDYPEYHSSGDGLEYVQPDALRGAYELCRRICEVLEQNATYMNLNPKCEPQLGRRGLYRAVAGQQEKQSAELTLLWALNLSDGHHSVLDIANRAGVPFNQVWRAVQQLQGCGLLEKR